VSGPGLAPDGDTSSMMVTLTVLALVLAIEIGWLCRC
jgi:hypothetical protein